MSIDYPDELVPTPFLAPANLGNPRSAVVPATSAPMSYGDAMGRRHLDRRVDTARQEAVAWAATPPNAERISAYLTFYGDVAVRSVTSRSRTLADYAALLAEWEVPGVRPPPDLSVRLSARWGRSVTLAVLRHLRREGHLA